MAIPDVNDLLLPILQLIGDGKAHHRDEAVQLIQRQFNLSVDDIRLQLESGNYKIDNQIDWVRANFTQFDIAENLGDGWFKILPCGEYILQHYSIELSVSFLKSFDCYEP